MRQIFRGFCVFQIYRSFSSCSARNRGTHLLLLLLLSNIFQRPAEIIWKSLKFEDFNFFFSCLRTLVKQKNMEKTNDWFDFRQVFIIFSIVYNVRDENEIIKMSRCGHAVRGVRSEWKRNKIWRVHPIKGPRHNGKTRPTTKREFSPESGQTNLKHHQQFIRSRPSNKKKWRRKTKRVCRAVITFYYMLCYV